MALNLPEKNQMFGSYKKRNISYKRIDKCTSWNENKEKEIYEDILGKEILSPKRERKILQTLLWIFTCSYNTTIAFLYLIPYYVQQIWKVIFYGMPQFRKGIRITIFIVLFSNRLYLLDGIC